MGRKLGAILMVMCMIGVQSSTEASIVIGQDGITPKIQTRYMLETDAKGQSGDVQITQTKAYVKFEQKAWDKMPIELRLNTKHTDIKDTTAVDLPSHLEGRSIDVGVKLPFFLVNSDTLFLGVDVSPTMNTDGWDEWASGAFRIPFRVYAIYKESEKFIFVLGANIRPEYDSEVVPLIGFRYIPNEQWEINFATSEPYIAYKLNDTTKVKVEVGFESDEYEVTRGSQKGVVFSYQEASAGVGVEHEFTEHFRAALSVGGVFARQLEYVDGNGKVDPEPGAYVSLALTGRF